MTRGDGEDEQWTLLFTIGGFWCIFGIFGFSSLLTTLVFSTPRQTPKAGSVEK
jgi:hypothetical protein